MGVKIGSGGYQSQTAAEFAGRRALEDFLKALLKKNERNDKAALFSSLFTNLIPDAASWPVATVPDACHDVGCQGNPDIVGTGPNRRC
jgi:hypothetical protein